MSRKIRRNVLTAIAVAAGTLAVAAPSQAQAATYEFQPIALTAWDIEDWWESCDEPRMHYNGSPGWAGTICNMGTVSGSSIPKTRFTSSGFELRLMERDGGWDANHLGTTWISNAVLNEERTVNFIKWNDFHYEFKYRVVRVA